tara:strand:- start:4169 stop:4660 length:492 start_codon:yes stop_codon:yes gene_type:complete
MKTGVDLLENDKFTPIQIDFLRKTVAIMKVLTEEAMNSAEKFTKSCGRTIVTGNDMYYALMFEAHEFFEKDIDQRFFEELSIEHQHTYETDDEDDEEAENLTESTENEEAYILDCKVSEMKEFHDKVIMYAEEWRNWFPEDPVQMMIKNAIDKTQAKIDGDMQ